MDMPPIAVMIYELLRGELILHMIGVKFDKDLEVKMQAMDADDTFTPWNNQWNNPEVDDTTAIANIVTDRGWENVKGYVEKLWAVMKALYFKRESDPVMTSTELREKFETLILEYERDIQTNDELGAMDEDDNGAKKGRKLRQKGKPKGTLAPAQKPTKSNAGAKSL